MQLSPESKLILSCVKITSTHEELETIDNLISKIKDWDYLVFTIIKRGAASLLYRKLPLLLNNNLIPSEAERKLKKTYYTTLNRNVKLYETFAKVAETFNKHNIRFIALKGIYLSEYLYQDIGLRQFSDIDLLVNEADGSTCLKLLKKLGFHAEHEYTVNEFIDSKSQAHYNAMVFNEMSVEIHVKLQNASEKYQQNLDEIWQKAQSITLNNVNAESLEFTDLLIHLCLHLDKHFISSHLQFTCFNDIVNLLWKISSQQTTDNRQQSTVSSHQLSENFDWDKFEKKCINEKYSNTVFKYLVMVHNIYNAPLPDVLNIKYQYLLTEEDEERFFRYLSGDKNEFVGYQKDRSKVEVHLIHLKKLHTFSDFFKYGMGIIFPSKSFMIEKYGLDASRQLADKSQHLAGSPVSRDVEILHKQQVDDLNQNYKLQMVAKRTSRFSVTTNYKLRFWWLWYPCRWWVGVKGLVKLILRERPPAPKGE